MCLNSGLKGLSGCKSSPAGYTVGIFVYPPFGNFLHAPIYCALKILDTQDRPQYTPTNKKEVLININLSIREQLIKWSCPRSIEFRADLPKTLVGKIAYNALEKEEIAKLKAEGKYVGS